MNKNCTASVHSPFSSARRHYSFTTLSVWAEATKSVAFEIASVRGNFQHLVDRLFRAEEKQLLCMHFGERRSSQSRIFKSNCGGTPLFANTTFSFVTNGPPIKRSWRCQSQILHRLIASGRRQTKNWHGKTGCFASRFLLESVNADDCHIHNFFSIKSAGRKMSRDRAISLNTLSLLGYPKSWFSPNNSFQI